MKSIKYLFLFIIFVIFCSHTNMPERRGFVSPHHEFLDPILDDLANELYQDYGIRVAGVGGGTTIDHKLKEVSLRYDIKQCLSEDELRRLMIDITERLIKKVNANEGIQKHLNHVPFGLESITLGVFLRNNNGSRIYHPNICIGSQNWGELGYITLERDDPYGFNEICEETYEEALEKINRN